MSPEQERRIRAAVFPPFIGETSEADVCALLRELDSLRALCQAIRREALEEAAWVCVSAIRALADAPDHKCSHEWVDARNQVTSSGEMCVRCGAIRADAPDAGARKEGEG